MVRVSVLWDAYRLEMGRGSNPVPFGWDWNALATGEGEQTHKDVSGEPSVRAVTDPVSVRLVRTSANQKQEHSGKPRLA